MSTILKALYRLEEERAPALERPLRDEVAAAPPLPRGAGRGLWLAVGGALLFGIGLGASALWLRPALAPETPARAAVEREAPDPAPEAPPARGLVAAAALPEVPAESGPTPSDDRELAEADALAEADELAGEFDLEEILEPVEEFRELPTAALESPVEVVALQPEKRAKAAAPPVRRPRVPIPRIFVGKTLWHPTPERRVAWVEVAAGSTIELREGDSVDGLVVKSIAPSSVSFDYEGTEVLRRVGLAPR